MQLPLVSFVILATTASASALVGIIACQGSAQCANKAGTATELVGYINSIDDLVRYENGQHIACTAEGPICAFLQNFTNGLEVAASDIKPLAAAIISRGCSSCGSAPFLKSDGSVQGELTFNFVPAASAGGCVGVC
ncbi:killer toxin [Mycena leptocephala]|nr:killer toxin [Mycena leptocephala]